MPAEEQVETWLKEFDLDVDGTISEHEFVTGIKKWTNRVAQDKAFYQAQQASAANIGDSAFWAQKSNEAKAVIIYSQSSTAVCLDAGLGVKVFFSRFPPNCVRASMYD